MIANNYFKNCKGFISAMMSREEEKVQKIGDMDMACLEELDELILILIA